MLFARLDSNSVNDATRKPLIEVEAQTVAEILAAVRRRQRREQTDDYPEYADHEYRMLAEREFAWEMREQATDFEREWYMRSRTEERRQYQLWALGIGKDLIGRTLDAYAQSGEGRRLHRALGVPISVYAENYIDLLVKSPVAVDLGRLPVVHGESAAFKIDVASRLEQFWHRRPMLFPLIVSVGVTVFYFESQQGKDLDNILLDLLPIVLEKLGPPSDDITPWARIDSSQLGPAPSGLARVSFIEAIALKGVASKVCRPGTVILVLSPGDRRASWWSRAYDWPD